MAGTRTVRCLASGIFSTLPQCVFDGEIHYQHLHIHDPFIRLIHNILQGQLIKESEGNFHLGCVLPVVKNGRWLGDVAPGEPMVLICDEGYVMTLGVEGKLKKLQFNVSSSTPGPVSYFQDSHQL